MPAIFQLSSQGTAGNNAGGTLYRAPLLGFFGNNASTTEANVQVAYRTVCVLSNLFILVQTNGVSASSTLVSRIGGASGNLSVSIGAGITGEFEDTTHTDAISAGNLVNYRFTIGAGGTSIVSIMAGVQVDRLTHHHGSALVGSFSAAATSNFVLSAGSLISTLTEPFSQYTWRAVGTFQNLYVIVSTAAAFTHTFTLRKNTANTALTVSVTTSTTGTFEDVTHTETTTAGGDLYNVQLITGAGSGTSGVALLSTEFVSTRTSIHLLSSTPGGDNYLASTTSYRGLAGSTSGSTESQFQTKLHVAGVLSNLTCYVVSTAATTTTVKSRINTADGNMSLSIGTGGAGIFEDVTHSDTVKAADVANYQIVTSSGGAFNITYLGSLFTAGILGEIVKTNEAIRRARHW